MRSKSKGVRRNSCGYGLEDDARVAADLGISDGASSIRVLEDLDPAAAVLSRSDTVSGHADVKEHGLGSLLDAGSCWPVDPAVCDVADTGVRRTGGITIRDPDSDCRSGVARFDGLPGFVDYVGKGKRKVDDMLALPSHVLDVAADVASAPFVDTHAGNNVFWPSSSVATTEAPNCQSIFSHMNAGSASAGPSTSNVMPPVVPGVFDGPHFQQPSCSPPPMRTPPAYGLSWA